jgi:hypothetical protein
MAQGNGRSAKPRMPLSIARMLLAPGKTDHFEEELARVGILDGGQIT